ncbi:T9SS type A sorting domain-containing protein [Psychroserpens damuponensis]|uniref:T9SS type A sorting domain-containing protein n=1 Tax=Psychroserpens damuponensis TaxID=943936 RepID=UPI00058BAD75|nr:T9SS type A sorting domain-containing protein [Psychroserpens damuponensis]
MRIYILLMVLSIQFANAQNFTEYHTGSTIDVTTNHQPGACLMGGATEHDNAMIWFLNKADEGDIVVLRASGGNGYNDYFYSQLGVTVNSVTTFVIHNETGAIDPYVLQRVANAEAVWFAGGDQYNYVSYFKDNAMEEVLNTFVNVKQGVIGGTSAGLAILGGSYFSAENGTLTNAQALSNPYHDRATIGYNDFLNLPYLNNLITDSHYDDPDRRARHSVMLARIATDNATHSFGIGCNEYTAVCIEPNGKGYVYGDYPAYEEFAYFLQANCVTDFEPETCVSGLPLTWDRNNEAIKVYKVPGTNTGVNYFDLSNWETGSGGQWENWSVDNGVFNTDNGTNPMCGALSVEDFELTAIKVFPNPFQNTIQIMSDKDLKEVQIIDVLGNISVVNLNTDNTIDTSTLTSGMYFLKLKTDTVVQTLKIVKR